MNDDDKTAAWAMALLLGGLLFLVVGYCSVSLLLGRPFGIYAEETRKQIYDASRQYQQGTQLDLARYCVQYQQAKGSGKTALAGLIRDTRATYAGPVTDNVERCLAELGDN